jgi:hypothetical protein
MTFSMLVVAAAWAGVKGEEDAANAAAFCCGLAYFEFARAIGPTYECCGGAIFGGDAIHV